MFTNESSFTRISLANNAKSAKVFLGELGVFARKKQSLSCLVSLRLGLVRRRSGLPTAWMVEVPIMQEHFSADHD